jgi:hypothetical protein
MAIKNLRTNLCQQSITNQNSIFAFSNTIHIYMDALSVSGCDKRGVA